MTEPYKVLVVDDEPPARDLLKVFISQIPNFEQIGSCSTAIQALSIIETNTPDLIFLDINMPQITGLEFLQFSQISPLSVILTTAYAEHALQSYDFGVIDYLLKPIAFDRFVKAVTKFKESKSREGKDKNDQNVLSESDMRLFLEKANSFESNLSNADSLWLREEKRVIQIKLDDILYVEGLKDYVKVHLTNKIIVSHLTIGKAEEIFKSPTFIRIHRSYIVRQSAISSIHGNTVRLTNLKDLPIGGLSYRDVLKRHISLL